MRAALLPSPCGHCGRSERLVSNGLTNVCVACAVRLLDAHLAFCRLGCDGDERCAWAREFRRRIVAVREDRR